MKHFICGDSLVNAYINQFTFTQCRCAQLLQYAQRTTNVIILIVVDVGLLPRLVPVIFLEFCIFNGHLFLRVQ